MFPVRHAVDAPQECSVSLKCSGSHAPLLRVLLLSTALILTSTALAKLYTVSRFQWLLVDPNPVFPFLRNQVVLLIASMLELIVTVAVLFGRNTLFSAASVFSLASMFLLYRIGLYAAGGHSLCFCLGLSAPWLQISTEKQDLIAKWLLAYLLLVGIGALLFQLTDTRINRHLKTRLCT